MGFLMNRQPSAARQQARGLGSQATARQRFQKQMRIEQLEDRRLLAQLVFGTPSNLGTGVNTIGQESSPTTTADGLNLLFKRFETEILEATRSSTSEPFGNVVSAGSEVNAGGFPSNPEVSDDGLTLLFSYNEDGLLRQATRASRSQPFGSITSLGNLLPGQSLESPSISADGLTLYFTAWDTMRSLNDIYQATRPSVSDPWGNVATLGPAINTPGYKDAMPSISTDGLMLFFNSNRPGGFGSFDLYASTRATLSSPWGNAVNLGPQVNSAADDKGAEISADGTVLYFHSNRTGGAGDEDLYQVAVGYANDAKFYVVNDAAANQTFEYDAAGLGVDNYVLNSGNTSPRGAASNVTGDTVWVADKNRKVYVYNTSGGLIGSWSAGTLASNALVEGVATNGTDVWIVDSKSDKVFRYSGAASRTSGSQNADSSFSLNSSNGNSTGIVTDGTYLWGVNSSTTDKVFKYTLSGSLIGSWSIDLANKTPTGLTIDPTGASQSIWIVDSGTDKVYEYANARATTSGSLSASSTFALASGNTNPQGIADPPPPGTRLQATTASLAPASLSLAPSYNQSAPTVVTTTGAGLSTSDPRRDERASRVDQAWVMPGSPKLQLRDSNVSAVPPVRSERMARADKDDAREAFDEALLDVLSEAELDQYAHVFALSPGTMRT